MYNAADRLVKTMNVKKAAQGRASVVDMQVSAYDYARKERERKLHKRLSCAHMETSKCNALAAD